MKFLDFLGATNGGYTYNHSNEEVMVSWLGIHPFIMPSIIYNPHYIPLDMKKGLMDYRMSDISLGREQEQCGDYPRIGDVKTR
jgi:hypothetical protein